MKVNTTYEPYSQEPEYIDANRDLLGTLPLDRVRRVLDLACGTGLLTDLLLQLKPDLAVTGVDLDPQQLEIASRLFREKGLLAEDDAGLERGLESGKGAVRFMRGSADELDFDEGRFDLAMMGNAIHLMPDKDRFLAGVQRVLAPGGSFTFNSVFFVGTFAEGTEPAYTEWLKQAVEVLGEKNAALRAEGKPTIPRQRGRAGKAFDKGWLSPEQWAEALDRNGFDVGRTYKREVGITRRGLELVGAYGGLAEVLMSGYPVEVASECLQEGARRAFEVLKIEQIPRFWLEMTATKR
jgi:ubiquinone/menaquinone biosynthesis C-methylase UbiE